METKICRYCGEEKPIEEYETSSTYKGKTYRRHKCHLCRTDSKRRRKDGIRLWLLEMKKELKCDRCPVDDYRCLQFHHRENNKSFNIADMIANAYGRDAIKKEIAKCDVLCANCHQILHFIEFDGNRMGELSISEWEEQENNLKNEVKSLSLYRKN